jgi:hypothetical protein
MIRSARLLQAVMVGPREGGFPETLSLPPRREGLVVVMTAEPMGLLVKWTLEEESGEVLVPWVNVRDVYGQKILTKSKA